MKTSQNFKHAIMANATLSDIKQLIKANVITWDTEMATGNTFQDDYVAHAVHTKRTAKEIAKLVKNVTAAKAILSNETIVTPVLMAMVDKKDFKIEDAKDLLAGRNIEKERIPIITWLGAKCSQFESREEMTRVQKNTMAVGKVLILAGADLDSINNSTDEPYWESLKTQEGNGYTWVSPTFVGPARTFVNWLAEQGIEPGKGSLKKAQKAQDVEIGLLE